MVGATIGKLKHVFLIGIEYQYWHNKFVTQLQLLAPELARRLARRCFEENITFKSIGTPRS